MPTVIHNLRRHSSGPRLLASDLFPKSDLPQAGVGFFLQDGVTMPASKKTRFEVFKRDSFTCQYCGRSAPDVTLQADHIKPVAAGGEDDIINLVTSCVDCNQGRGARELSSAAVITKRHAQLTDLQNRREQLEMMVEWQRSLTDIDGAFLQAACDIWAELTPGYSINAYGQGNVRKWLRRFGFVTVCEAMRAAATQYAPPDADGTRSPEAVDAAYDKVPKIAAIMQDERDQPWLKDVFYIRGIVRNRLRYYDPHECIRRLTTAFEAGVSPYDAKQVALQATSWGAWVDGMDDLTREARTC